MFYLYIGINLESLYTEGLPINTVYAISLSMLVYYCIGFKIIILMQILTCYSSDDRQT